MARPLVTTEGRTRPSGNAKAGKANVGGLLFPRIRGVRRIKTHSFTPRKALDMFSPDEQLEEDFQVWYARYGGTRPEYIVYNYLKKRKGMQEGLDFIYQSSRGGGRTRSGGSVVDFELPFLRLFIRVQGEHFHATLAAEGVDRIKAIALEGQSGFKVVDVWAIPLAQATDRVMEAALRGITLGKRPY